MLVELGMSLLIILIIVIIISLPLYFAVKLLGGDASIFRVFLALVLVAVVERVLAYFVTGFLGWIITGVIGLFIYKQMFDLGWIKALLAVLLAAVIAWVLVFVAGLLGISLLSL